MNVRDALQTTPLFARLSEDTLTRVIAVAIPRVHAPGATIIHQGEPCEAAYFITSGEVRVYRLSPGGREQVLTRLGPGRTFNTVPVLLPGSVNHATAEAVTETTTLALLREDFLRLVSEHSDLALALLQDFAERLDHLTDLVEDLSLRTVRGRLARFLLEQAEAGAVTRRWTQDEIAAQLGTVRDMVSRTLRAFADAELIRMDRQRIELIDRQGLKAEVIG